MKTSITFETSETGTFDIATFDTTAENSVNNMATLLAAGYKRSYGYRTPEGIDMMVMERKVN